MPAFSARASSAAARKGPRSSRPCTAASTPTTPHHGGPRRSSRPRPRRRSGSPGVVESRDRSRDSPYPAPREPEHRVRRRRSQWELARLSPGVRQFCFSPLATVAESRCRRGTPRGGPAREAAPGLDLLSARGCASRVRRRAGGQRGAAAETPSGAEGGHAAAPRRTGREARGRARGRAAGRAALAGCGAWREEIDRGGRDRRHDAERVLAAANPGKGAGRDMATPRSSRATRRAGRRARSPVDFLSIDGARWRARRGARVGRRAARRGRRPSGDRDDRPGRLGHGPRGGPAARRRRDPSRSCRGRATPASGTSSAPASPSAGGHRAASRSPAWSATIGPGAGDRARGGGGERAAARRAITVEQERAVADALVDGAARRGRRIEEDPGRANASPTRARTRRTRSRSRMRWRRSTRGRPRSCCRTRSPQGSGTADNPPRAARAVLVSVAPEPGSTPELRALRGGFPRALRPRTGAVRGDRLRGDALRARGDRRRGRPRRTRAGRARRLLRRRRAARHHARRLCGRTARAADARALHAFRVRRGRADYLERWTSALQLRVERDLLDAGERARDDAALLRGVAASRTPPGRSRHAGPWS